MFDGSQANQQPNRPPPTQADRCSCETGSKVLRLPLNSDYYATSTWLKGSLRELNEFVVPVPVAMDGGSLFRFDDIWETKDSKRRVVRVLTTERLKIITAQLNNLTSGKLDSNAQKNLGAYLVKSHTAARSGSDVTLSSYDIENLEEKLDTLVDQARQGTIYLAADRGGGGFSMVLRNVGTEWTTALCAYVAAVKCFFSKRKEALNTNPLKDAASLLDLSGERARVIQRGAFVFPLSYDGITPKSSCRFDIALWVIRVFLDADNDANVPQLIEITDVKKLRKTATRPALKQQRSDQTPPALDYETGLLGESLTEKHPDIRYLIVGSEGVANWRKAKENSGFPSSPSSIHVVKNNGEVYEVHRFAPTGNLPTLRSLSDKEKVELHRLWTTAANQWSRIELPPPVYNQGR